MAKMIWTPEAEQALSRVPFLLRSLARGKLEQRIRDQGRASVTLADCQAAEQQFRAVLSGKNPAEVQQALPQENTAGVQMIVVETCHGTVADCPNRLIDVPKLREAIEEWITRSGISETLRQRISDERILFHHKFRISISGCPNACSRPQIADIGVVGFVMPEGDMRDCTACGACVRACPDQAITLTDAGAAFDRQLCQGCTRCRDACEKHLIRVSAPAFRILAGGKLGRHPRLSAVVSEVSDPRDVVLFLDKAITDFAKRDDPQQRFADFWASHSPDKGRRSPAP